ncbi:MAG: GtrA family protein [bacterium]|nr:GtrA family protein [bacterium]
MRTLSKRDILSAMITGLTAGVIAWAVLVYLQKSLPLGFGPAWLVLVIPMLWLAGVQFGYFLGRWMTFFDQFGKYAAIGFTNFAVDAGVFNLLLSLTHVTAGPGYAAQKTASFVIAVTHSYAWNRWWAFHSRREVGTPTEASERGGRQFFKFLAVNILAAVINVGIATLVVSVLHRPANFSPEVWANVGAIAGSAFALIFSFVGFRLVVFK